MTSGCGCLLIIFGILGIGLFGGSSFTVLCFGLLLFFLGALAGD